MVTDVAKVFVGTTVIGECLTFQLLDPNGTAQQEELRCLQT
jgi:hypothetical protein